VRAPKPIGRVTHFYNAIGVAIVRFTKPVKIGELVRFNGSTTDFSQIVVSMQYSHKPIQSAIRGREVGIKVDQRVREGDEVFLA
jgi:acyl dehydratase